MPNYPKRGSRMKTSKQKSKTDMKTTKRKKKKSKK